MSIPFLGEIFSGAAEIIGNFVASPEEKLKANQALVELQIRANQQALDHEVTLIQEQGQNVRSETTGHSWMQRNWRPIIMLLFGYIIAHNYVIAPIVGAFFPYALMSLEIPPDMWALLKIGLGGYVVGRSAEKIVPQVWGNGGKNATQ